MPTKYSFINAQKFLIKPSERIRFVFLFLLATGGSLIAARFITHQLDFLIFGDICTIPCAIIKGIITGTLAGTFQWLVLRRYVPNWMWIVVFTLFLICANCSNTISTMIISSILDAQFELTQAQILLAVFFIVNIGILLALGYSQWLILRLYVSKSRWWITIPLIAGAYVLAASYIFEFLKDVSLFKFNTDFIKLTGLAVVQSLGFCLLQRRPRENSLFSSYLALAPDITNYWDIQKLARKLYTRVTKTWKTDLAESSEKLIYLVGVDRSGSITAYEPMNQTATEKVEQTPLLNLVVPSRIAGSEIEDSVPLAKFQVTFIPPGEVDVVSCRGVPLIWLAIVTFAGTLGVGKLLGSLGIMAFL